MSEKGRFLVGWSFILALFILESWAFDLRVVFTPPVLFGYILGWLFARWWDE